VYRNHRDFDDLISASTVPPLRNPVDRLSMLEGMIAFGIVFVDCFPRGQDEDFRKVLVVRKPHVQLALAQWCYLIQRAYGIKNASLKEDVAWACSVMNKVLHVDL
jgi:hypothetical protein